MRRQIYFSKHFVFRGGLANEVPEFLWHYLSDADTRLKSKEYADVQNAMIDKCINFLRAGIIPTDTDLNA